MGREGGRGGNQMHATQRQLTLKRNKRHTHTHTKSEANETASDVEAMVTQRGARNGGAIV